MVRAPQLRRSHPSAFWAPSPHISLIPHTNASLRVARVLELLSQTRRPQKNKAERKWNVRDPKSPEGTQNLTHTTQTLGTSGLTLGGIPHDSCQRSPSPNKLPRASQKTRRTNLESQTRSLRLERTRRTRRTHTVSTPRIFYGPHHEPQKLWPLRQTLHTRDHRHRSLQKSERYPRPPGRRRSP